MPRQRKQAGAEPASDTNGNLPDPPPSSGDSAPEEKKRPVMSLKFPTDRVTNIEVAVWAHALTLQSGDEVQVHSVTIQRSYRDAQGNWQKNSFYRAHDIPVLLHALSRSFGWILDQRELSVPF